MDRGFAPLRIVLGVLVLGVIALLGFLILQGVKPTIKNPQPLNGSRTPKGDVTISAEVRGEANLDKVILRIDGREVEPIITTHSERFWEVRYQAALPKGTHQAEIVAIDTRGREQPYAWSFNASGPTNPPKFANPLPRNGAKLPPGEALISLATFSELTTISTFKLTLDGSSLVSNPDIRQGANERTVAQVRRTLAPGKEYKVVAEAVDQEGEKATYEWRFTVAADAASADTIFFKETETYVFAPFAEFWTKNGGLAIFGYPITPDFEQGSTRVQWFERARFEVNPTTPTVQQVRLGLLGYVFRKNPDPPLTSPPPPDRRFFPETGHSIGGAFRAYWEARGGIAIFGLPLTEEITENGRTVQWFERARFELNPQAAPDQQVQLGQIGRAAWEQSGPR